MDAIKALLMALGLFAAFYLSQLLRAILQCKEIRPQERLTPSPRELSVGFVTNFFDTLGIGSYATTTSLYRFWKMVKDEVIPGTLNIGHMIPTFAQAFIYTQIVEVDPKTLILMIAASTLGAWLGAGIVAGWPRRNIQIGMGLALIVATTLMFRQQVFGEITGSESLGLTGTKLAIGLAANFLLGALMMLGIGLYGPCMIVIGLLGMNVKSAFPIMMGSCAFLMPVGNVQFFKKGAFDLKAALGLAVGGLPAVLIAAYLVKSLPLSAVRWLVIVVVLYAAVNLLLTARRERIASALE